MHISILHNCDGDLLEDDPGREARKDVMKVAAAISEALKDRGVKAESIGLGATLRDVIGVADELQRRRPDLVLNLCESLAADSRGEMAIPCLLDLLDIP